MPRKQQSQQWAPLLFQGRRPPKLSLLMLPVWWDSNNLQGKVTLPTSTTISPGSVPEKHHAAQQDLKAGVQSLAEPRPWNKLTLILVCLVMLLKRTMQLISTAALTTVTYCCTACLSPSTSILWSYTCKTLEENLDMELKCHYQPGVSLGSWPMTMEWDVELSSSFARA